MEHDKLVQVIRHAIMNRDDSPLSRDPEDYDIDAIVDELIATAPEGPVQELDHSDYWATIAKHKKNA